ncbi:hypothetical protein SO802_021709 [Lithocarpus litseifolius]|uniref:Maturase K n=1 Tax=Lithocarpus litseifolius TaxID=425828 RepID=A0AAW2CHR1_9ROSI
MPKTLTHRETDSESERYQQWQHLSRRKERELERKENSSFPNHSTISPLSLVSSKHRSLGFILNKSISPNCRLFQEADKSCSSSSSSFSSNPNAHHLLDIKFPKYFHDQTNLTKLSIYMGDKVHKQSSKKSMGINTIRLYICHHQIIGTSSGIRTCRRSFLEARLGSIQGYGGVKLEDSRNSLPLSYPRVQHQKKENSQLFSPSHTYGSSSKEKDFFKSFSSFCSQFKARVILALSLHEPVHRVLPIPKSKLLRLYSLGFSAFRF